MFICKMRISPSKEQHDIHVTGDAGKQEYGVVFSMTFSIFFPYFLTKAEISRGLVYVSDNTEA